MKNKKQATMLSQPSAYHSITKIIILATVVALFFLFNAKIAFPGGAAMFLDYCNVLFTGQHLPSYMAQRDIGFPLMIFFSGYKIHASLVPLILMQALMAVLIPVFCYLMVRPVFPRLASLSATVVIFTLSPFFFMKWIHHDQCYIFFLVLASCLLVMFVTEKKTYLLYAMTAAIIAASLARPAGNLLYPMVFVLAYLYVRGPLLRYIINFAIFVAVILLYSHHRYVVFDMAHQKSIPSYTGKQIFYNFYVNANEFHVKLTPELGNAMHIIMDKAKENIGTDPKTSDILKRLEPEDFLQKHYYPYSTEQLIAQLYSNPNSEYYAFLSDEGVPDKVFLQASWDIMRAYPWYGIAYTARNTWKFMYDPGYNHGRYSITPLSKEGIANAFVLEGENPKLYGETSSRAVREIEFNTTKVQPHLMKVIYRGVRLAFIQGYDGFSRVLFYLIMVAWIASVLPFFARFFSLRSLKASGVLDVAKKVSAPVILLSAILLQNVLITCMFAEPNYRYHHFLLPIKIVLACYGLGVLIYLVRHIISAGMVRDEQFVVGQSASIIRQVSFVSLFILTCALFWLQYMAYYAG